jgi:hypothetical protein
MIQAILGRHGIKLCNRIEVGSICSILSTTPSMSMRSEPIRYSEVFVIWPSYALPSFGQHSFGYLVC